MKIKYTTLVLSFTLFLCATAIGFAQTSQLSSDDFNNGFGNWNDGGGDCFLNNYNSGCLDDSGKILLRDNSGASSSLFSDTYDLTNYDSITVDFEYLVNSFENNENWYIEFSSDNGFNYSIISNYIVDVDFTENVCYNETVTIYALDHTFNNQNRIRFRADASGNGDYLYLDDIVISGNANDNLFFEDFEDETQGDTSGTDDVNNINWSSSEGSNTDRLEVRNGNYFEAVDTDAVVSWFTDPITITNYNNLNLSLDLTTANLDDSDYINIKYKLNGGNVQPFLTETNDYNGALTADLSSLSGDTLEIIIEFKSSSNNEYHRIDNVKLTGISACSAPTTYNVTGDDLSICSGSSETTAIGLDGSESGVTYQLLKDGVDEGTAIAGTGNSISFGDFSASGTYTVEATRTDDGCTQTMTGNVIVTVTAIVDASFNTSATSIEVGESITFTDTSTGSPTSWSWDFDGDGSADATTQNPTHTFTTDGTYTVTLTASNSCGSDTATTTITVSVASEVLFYEDFDYNYEATTGTDSEGTNWYSDLSGADQNDDLGKWFGKDGEFEAEKVDGTAIWYTDPITISGYTNLEFTIFNEEMKEIGSGDSITLKYIIDGVAYTAYTYTEDISNNTTIGGALTGVVGDQIILQIVVTHAGDKGKHKFTNVKLEGSPTYNVWQGGQGDLVTNTAKWSKGSQPTAATSVWIPNGKHLTLVDDRAFNAINIRSTANLTIAKTGSLTTSYDFTKIAGEGTVTLNSDATEFASIIVEGTATGEITYNKYINYLAYQEWDLVGSPVLNQNMQSFAQTHTNSNNTNNTGSLAFDDPYYALGEYLTEWGSFSNYTTSTIPNSSFPAGKGYQMATNPTGSGNDMEGQTLAFTGEIATASQSINVQNQNGANNNNGRRWNLVSNPYPSYLKANEIADGGVGNVNNFISQNLSIMDQSFGGVYGWKADGSGYKAYNLANLSDQGIPEALLIAPGQGFMIAASSTDIASLQFTPAMRSVVGGDDFISGAPMLLNHFLKLQLFNGSSQKGETSFFFQPNLTLGLNPGYDAGNLDQNTTLSSRLVQDDQGVNLEINAMDIESLYNQTIPLVINQQEGQSFRISISNNTLPEDINVYLEDVFNGTLTSLKNQDFELVAQEDLSQDGRFYIRFTTESLAINNVLSPSNISVFKLNTDNFITIKGLSPEMGKTSAALYNMLGMKVAAKALNSNTSTQTISTQGLASGVYIITLTAGEQAISKKIIIQ